MIPITVYNNRKLALFGLGISGLSAARSLVAGGASPIVFDENEERCDKARQEGFIVEDLRNLNWQDIEALVLSPGVPLTHPEPHWSVLRATASGVPVIGDTDLFFSEFLARGQRDRVIAITGTNGKSTTTALAAHILNVAGVKAQMGGNIGVGILGLNDFGGGQTYVVELSSYQIDLTPSLCPTAAGLLNITPDHLDRHGTIEHYRDVKGRIFAQLSGDQLAVVSLDDPYCRDVAKTIPNGVPTAFVASDQEVGKGIEIGDAKLILREDSEAIGEIDLSTCPSLRGRHNWQNAAFAYLLCSHITDNKDGLMDGLASFPGLAHRMQEVGRFKREGLTVLFINDSKATNADACEQALKSFDDIYWIAGGLAKDGGIETLTNEFSRVRKACLIGEAADQFGQFLALHSVQYEDCKTLDIAVTCAFEAALDAGSGEVAVLLSPAAASFDQYANFELRGDAFEEIVSRLEGVEKPFGGEV